MTPAGWIFAEHGACANCGGLFGRTYSVLKGVDMVIPVDIYLPGCPPRPEALTDAVLQIQKKIMGEKWTRRMKGERA